MVEFVVWSSVAGGRSIRVLELLQQALASSCRASQRNGFLCRIVFKGAGSQSQGGMAGGAQRSHTLSCHLERVLCHLYGAILAACCGAHAGIRVFSRAPATASLGVPAPPRCNA